MATSYAAVSSGNKLKSGSGAISTAVKTQAFETHLWQVYQKAGLAKTSLNLAVYRKALVGYYNLRAKAGTAIKPIVTIVDFSRSSRQKRLWVLDLKNQKLLYYTYVAHGKGTGDEYARFFSNKPNSFKSSLGFYLTAQTYQGKHGLSLKLNGLDKNFNTNALSRAVVIHGADYVSERFIKQYGRLGRSLGCPALPVKETQAIIGAIKNNSCLYIYGADKNYASPYLTEALAIDTFAAQFFPMKATS
ncbi:murein L,D-transpeptidase catalytic domain family protein [Adhaeribacter swui]|uniref:Murein L,D-transpeptidase catalytic domain family protein n=2 Tax=Adhaeribacter swui TaxID=2086471 RepID=A0A7G7GFG1_9BACT|nr:murein L,D-transpeptidase catalytic domain family protein [Adhaeribacter swui]